MFDIESTPDGSGKNLNSDLDLRDYIPQYIPGDIAHDIAEFSEKTRATTDSLGLTTSGTLESIDPDHPKGVSLSLANYLDKKFLPFEDTVLEACLAANLTQFGYMANELLKRGVPLRLRGGTVDYLLNPNTKDISQEIRRDIIDSLLPAQTTTIDEMEFPILPRSDLPLVEDQVQGHWIDFVVDGLTTQELNDFLQKFPSNYKGNTIYHEILLPNHWISLLARNRLRKFSQKGLRRQFREIPEGKISQILLQVSYSRLGLDPSFITDDEDIPVGVKTYNAQTISINTRPTEFSEESPNFRLLGCNLDKLTAAVYKVNEESLQIDLPDKPESCFFDQEDLDIWERLINKETNDNYHYNSARFIEAVARYMRKSFHYAIPAKDEQTNVRLKEMLSQVKDQLDWGKYQFLMAKSSIDFYASFLWSDKTERMSDWVELYDTLGLEQIVPERFFLEPKGENLVKQPLPQKLLKDYVPGTPTPCSDAVTFFKREYPWFATTYKFLNALNKQKLREKREP